MATCQNCNLPIRSGEETVALPDYKVAHKFNFICQQRAKMAIAEAERNEKHLALAVQLAAGYMASYSGDCRPIPQYVAEKALDCLEALEAEMERRDGDNDRQ